MISLKHTTAALVIVLSACGGGSADYSEPAAPAQTPDLSSNNWGLGWDYSVRGPRGIMLRYSSADTLFATRFPGTLPDPVQYEQLFDHVLACTGLSAPMPLVIFVTRSEMLDFMRRTYNPSIPTGDDAPALFLSPNTLLIRTPLEATSPHMERASFQHESVHYALFRNGDPTQLSGDLAVMHSSPFFESCVQKDGGPLRDWPRPWEFPLPPISTLPPPGGA